MKKLITIITLLAASGAFAAEPMPVFEFADPSAKAGRKAYQQNRIARHAAVKLTAAKEKRAVYNQTHEHRMAVASAAWYKVSVPSTVSLHAASWTIAATPVLISSTSSEDGLLARLRWFLISHECIWQGVDCVDWSCLDCCDSAGLSPAQHGKNVETFSVGIFALPQMSPA
jgi:hypothetical protein